MKKIIFVLVLSIFLSFIKAGVYAKEPAQVLIINQVRGEECCSKGTLPKLKKQVEAHISKNIPAYFALRYDVLINEDYINYLRIVSVNHPETIKLGLLIENTPQLVNKSEVSHNFREENWFEAQNAFTIGYTQDESRKIVDYLFSKFYEKFGYYPYLTSSWMINTETLNYLHDYYQIKIHQITREQYGTDSYTLYGGPPHYPYPASRNWLFIPDYENSNPVFIVRQTVTDPLLNYGDDTSTFTSQPNDYIKGEKDFSYFKSLTDQAINQPDNQTGFALLGLENSMDDKYQEEYIAQLEYIGKTGSKGFIKFPSVDELSDYWKNNRVTVYSGKDFVGQSDNQAFWISTPSYRVRIIKYNDQIKITDFRLYDKNFLDPYINYTAKKNGFWIVPYLIDGSLKYIQTEQKKTFIVGPFQLTKDIEIESNAIILPSIFDKKTLNIKKYDDRIELSYKKNIKENVLISFNNDKIILKPIDKNDVYYQPIGANYSPIKYYHRGNSDFNLEWKVNDAVAFSLFNKCILKICEIKFISNPSLLTKVREIQYPFIFPEPYGRKINTQKSFFYPNNQYAVAGRNPIRLFLSARDDYNLPTIFSGNIKIFTSSPIAKTEIIKNSTLLFVQFIDLFNNKPQKYYVTIKLYNDLEIKLKEPIYFAPNCKNKISYCITHPIQAYWYFRSFIGDRTRK